MTELLTIIPALVKETKKIPTMRIILITACTSAIVIAYRLPDLILAMR